MSELEHPPLWVAREALARLLREHLDDNPGLSARQVARDAHVDPKTLRKILHGEGSAWSTLETASALLNAAGIPERLYDLDVVCAA